MLPNDFCDLSLYRIPRSSARKRRKPSAGETLETFVFDDFAGRTLRVAAVAVDIVGGVGLGRGGHSNDMRRVFFWPKKKPNNLTFGTLRICFARTRVILVPGIHTPRSLVVRSARVILAVSRTDGEELYREIVNSN